MPGADFVVNVPPTVLGSGMRALTPEEVEVAHKMGLTEEQYRVAKADLLLGDERRRERGRDLGETVSRIVEELGEKYSVRSVNWGSESMVWRIEIDTPSGPANLVLKRELVDDMLEARTASEFQRLRNMVYFALGRTDLIFGKRP